jgi:hypothetical protein
MVSHILLAVQALSLGHLLAARHITCPQHGDIMHVEVWAETTTVRSTEGADAPRTSALAPNEATAGAEHHHCLVCADNSRGCLLSGPAHTCVAPLLITRDAHRAPPAGFAPIELLLLSPKNSPPSA